MTEHTRHSTTGDAPTTRDGATSSARRRLAAGAVAAVISLVGAGCSSAPSETGTGSTGSSAGAQSTAHDKAVKFAECMRKNGVRAFPDPDASGELTIDGVLNGSSLDASTPAWKAAIGICKDLQPPGFTGHQRSAEQQEKALEFARCMRDSGVADFPDPTRDGPLVDTNRIPSAAGSGMAAINAAMQRCGDIYADELGMKGS